MCFFFSQFGTPEVFSADTPSSSHTTPHHYQQSQLSAQYFTPSVAGGMFSSPAPPTPGNGGASGDQSARLGSNEASSLWAMENSTFNMNDLYHRPVMDGGERGSGDASTHTPTAAAQNNVSQIKPYFHRIVFVYCLASFHKKSWLQSPLITFHSVKPILIY